MERIGDAVRGSLRSAGVPDAGLLADVTRVWPEAVGATIAAAAWPSRIGRDETLHVNAASCGLGFRAHPAGRGDPRPRRRRAARRRAAASPPVQRGPGPGAARPGG